MRPRGVIKDHRKMHYEKEAGKIGENEQKEEKP